MNILLVDEQEQSLNQLKNVIEQVVSESKIELTTNATQAWEYCKAIFIPDLSFISLDLDWFSLGIKLKKLNPKMKFIFCTSLSKYTTKALKPSANGYVMKPVTKSEIIEQIKALNESIGIDTSKKVYFNTFGKFDIYVNGTPLTFKREKIKEFLALLIDKNGEFINTTLAAKILYSDEEDEKIRNIQMKQVLVELNKILREKDIKKIIIIKKNEFAINKEIINCDKYFLLDGDATILNKYEGIYMQGYEWAKFPKE